MDGYVGFGSDDPFGPLHPAPDALAIPTEHGFEAEPPPSNDSEAARAKGWTVRVVVTATLLLALLNAPSLASWAATLPPERGGQAAKALADAWVKETAAWGLAAPRAAMHDAYDAKKSVSWGDLR